MGDTLRHFLRKPATIAGIVTALMFQVIFSVIWMTAYQDVNDNADKLHITVVNEDLQFGSAIIGVLSESLPFQIREQNDLAEAKERLHDRDTHMVLHIPASLSEDIQSQEGTGTLFFHVNESNPAMIGSLMSGVADKIVAAVNKQTVAHAVTGVLTNMQMSEQQAAIVGEGLSERVTGQLDRMHPVTNMASQMVPMMMVLASYVGSMIMGMNFEQSSMMIGPERSKWRKFAARSLLNIVAAILVSLLGTTLVILLGGQHVEGFLTLWLFQALFVATFMFTAQFFLLLFGIPGMLFNIILLSLQLVSSGAMVPRELLNDFYHGLSVFMPATYAVEGMMNILFGGPGISEAVTKLFIMLGATIVLGLAAVAIKKSPRPRASHGAQ
ncbi:DUF3533 domain-containing protein [Xylanibacillus composti]|uniref:ABC-2 type transporter transmembrane domain-containing protein n=1 Tax=Xylanibacillus composti TaxID=1572762 RepID=A0A8J4H909_9BACL|nr:ABC transporter permease [Xylanibacillus composti]MDT9723705.1 DUF3533 domain-containing protein [Xylanibacillus composti]GIQ71424.1 hypothetical protein XYCOK13_42480 [Xylanibacillus composti]